MIAELLDLPCVTNVFRLEITGATASRRTCARRRVRKWWSSRFRRCSPSTMGMNKERLPSLKGIMAAKKKPLEIKPAQLGDGARDRSPRWRCPPERAAGRIIGESAAAVPELVRLLQTEAKVL